MANIATFLGFHIVIKNGRFDTIHLTREGALNALSSEWNKKEKKKDDPKEETKKQKKIEKKPDQKEDDGEDEDGAEEK